jgi:hypothetical protein
MSGEDDIGPEQEVKEPEVTISITREMYEEMRNNGFYIGGDMHGTDVHISDEFSGITRQDDLNNVDAWGPVFGADDPTTAAGTENPTEHSSKTVMLEAEPKDLIEITEVHTGCRSIPEILKVVRRTNTYFGPDLRLVEKDHEFDGQEGGWRLTSPGPQSHLLLWKAVTDSEGYVQARTRYSTVSADINKVAAYDFCEQCGEPIKSPMHRSMAMLGQCNGGFNDE